MRILIPCEIRTDGSDNLYGYQLLKALLQHPKTVEVQHGIGWLFEDKLDYDIIHFQWLESIFRGKEPGELELERLRNALEHWKTRSKIIVTLHNEFPHYNDTAAFRKLYELIFSYTDGFIHLGEVSKLVMRNRYKKYLEDGEEIIIPHGNYFAVPNEINQDLAKEKLGYSDSDKILLCFGAIRSREELNLLISAYKKIKKESIKLLIGGRLPVRSRVKLNYFVDRFPIWIDRSIQLTEGFIAQDKIQFYANAADVFIIPRIDILNSGNVPLGFTFGKTVVGPDVGVVGEELKKTGNLVFNPEDIESISNAIHKAFELQKNGQGQNNFQYAKRELDWAKIANMHIEFYNRL